MTQISDIHTSCKNCVFATYNESTQTGCGLNYIDVYKKLNIQILEVYDYDKEFYVINDKKCIGYRELKWLDNNNMGHDVDMETKVSKFRSLNKIDYIAIIDTKKIKISDLEQIIDSFKTSQILPKKIYLIRYANIPDMKFNDLKIVLDKIECPWKIYTCVDDSPFSYFMDNIIGNDKSARFVLSIIENNNDSIAVVEKANKIVHEELGNFIILGNKDKTSIIFSGTVYKYGRATGENIFDNLENYKEV